MRAIRFWVARFQLRLLQRELESTEKDIRFARLDGAWIRARALNEYASELARERKRLNMRIEALQAKLPKRVQNNG